MRVVFFKRFSTFLPEVFYCCLWPLYPADPHVLMFVMKVILDTESKLLLSCLLECSFTRAIVRSFLLQSG